jgi:molybdopterin-guanine dinucleotide biosynthesis protein A
MNRNRTSLYSAVILAGGLNSRMGYPKYLAKIGNQPIIRRQFDVLQEIFNEIVVVTHPAHPFRTRPGMKVTTDLVADLGPLGGLFTGLRAASGAGVVLVACDMPFLESEAIRELLADFDYRRYDGRIPVGPSGLEPLHALYSQRILAKVETAVVDRDLSLQRLIAGSAFQKVDWSTRPTKTLVNLNTPEALEREQPPVVAASSGRRNRRDAL